MQAQAYEGYFENGRFFAAGKTIQIPEKRRVYITVLDEPALEAGTSVNEHAEAWRDFLSGISNISDEPLKEFERVKFREVDI